MVKYIYLRKKSNALISKVRKFNRTDPERGGNSLTEKAMAYLRKQPDFII